MKFLFAVPLITLLAAPAFAVTNYETSQPSSESTDIIEAEEYDETLDNGEVERVRYTEERMEARDEDIDYGDRTRTNRERHAINTSGDASDDQ